MTQAPKNEKDSLNIQEVNVNVNVNVNVIKGGGAQNLPKNESLAEGVQIFLLETGDKPEKGDLIYKWRGCHFFITLQFNHIYCVWEGESKVLFITLRIFSILSQLFKILIHVFIVLKPGIICTFLIHFVSLQKMLTALFNLV